MSHKPVPPARAKSRLRIVICGAGVGGLALALALKRKGYAPVVVERRTGGQIRDEGLFLTLAPNGINASRAIGLAEAIAAAGIETSGLAIHNERGKRLTLVNYGTHGGRFGAHSVTLRRGALSAVLLDAAIAAGIDVRLATEVTGIRQDGSGVTVHLGRTSDTFDAAIACDGLRSLVRAHIFPDLPPPVYSGLIGTGGFVDVPEVAPTDGIMHMTFGRNAFFGYIKGAGQPVYWFNSYPVPEASAHSVTDPAAHARFLESLHADDPLDNARILAAVAEVDRHYPIYDMPELRRWSRGNVLLMGDAAHAVAPHSGQGASLAIEDAVVLTACLAEAADPAAAFARFESLRRTRTQRAIRIGRMTGSQKHANGWIALRLRDLMLPLFMPLGVGAQENLYSFRADRTPLAQPG